MSFLYVSKPIDSHVRRICLRAGPSLLVCRSALVAGDVKREGLGRHDSCIREHPGEQPCGKIPAHAAESSPGRSNAHPLNDGKGPDGQAEHLDEIGMEPLPFVVQEACIGEELLGTCVQRLVWFLSPVQVQNEALGPKDDYFSIAAAEF
jgi:hypothetical protein